DRIALRLDPELASRIVWFDGYVTNVDRTVRNTNMLMWHKRLWLIDHGASLYFHHNWQNSEDHVRRPFVQIKDHVLLARASELQAANGRFTEMLSRKKIDDIIALIPDAWLSG